MLKIQEQEGAASHMNDELQKGDVQHHQNTEESGSAKASSLCADFLERFV